MDEREDTVPMMQSPRRQSPPVRWSTLLARGVAVSVVAVQLLGVAHLGLERHGVCWEHGTVTELQGSEAALPAAVHASQEPEFRAAGAGARLEDVEGHHHCSVQASRRDWAPSDPPMLALTVGPELDGLASSGALPRADAALLLRAPKQSPPSPA